MFSRKYFHKKSLYVHYFFKGKKCWLANAQKTKVVYLDESLESESVLFTWSASCIPTADKAPWFIQVPL